MNESSKNRKDGADPAHGAPEADASLRADPAGATPFMAQYLEVKARHEDALVFFRMGDFYELFFEDARKAAACLDIQLTHRGLHRGDPIPMAGVPVHAAESYLLRLIRAGFRVAVCEQTEDPSEARRRGSKSLVRREVVRIVTPGTLTEDALLEARAPNGLVAVAFDAGGGAGLAAADISTGRFEVGAYGPETLEEALCALAPGEILISEADAASPAGRAALSRLKERLTLRPDARADERLGERLFRDAFGVASLEGFGAFSGPELVAAGLLIDYLLLTQAGAPVRLDPPLRAPSDRFLAIDPATRQSLEIDASVRGQRQGSLLSAIDRTITSPGARLFQSRLARPLRDIGEIEARLDEVDFFRSRTHLRAAVRAELRGAGDPERARMRLAHRRGGPRDLAVLAGALLSGDRIAALVLSEGGAPSGLMSAAGRLSFAAGEGLGDFAALVRSALSDGPPAHARESGFIQPGFNAELDGVRALREGARGALAALQARYVEETGVSSLRVRHNNVLGYFLEVPARHAEPLMRGPLSERFFHRQSLANAARFTTAELSDLDRRIAGAEQEALRIEQELFNLFVEQTDSLCGPLSGAALALCAVDVAAGVAEWASEAGAVRPELSTSPVFEVVRGRHPVVEEALRKTGQGFTANDCRLDADGEQGPRLLLVTGPNMAGKSTFLRQNALFVVMAQAGLPVPADQCRLGVADRLFSRVGASDDLARGRSTFMVEMIETAAILNLAGPSSFVVLDEVGRGTATFDGLAIAWAAVEHLYERNRCRVLFATHYHELTRLAASLGSAGNASLRVREWKGDLIFLHEVVPGPADRSYGVQVARLAGLPPSAVRRAEAVLRRLESEGGALRPEGLPLFAHAAPPSPVPAPGVLERMLEDLRPDDLSPREALEWLYRLKAAASEGS